MLLFHSMNLYIELWMNLNGQEEVGALHWSVSHLKMMQENIKDSSQQFREWSLITGRGATKWENWGSETFCVPPQDRV